VGSKSKGLLPVVYTSLYKRIDSSINMPLYTEPNPSLGWPVGLGGRKARPGEQTSQLGPDEGGGGKGHPGAQPRRLELVTSGSSEQGTLGGGQVSEGGLVGVLRKDCSLGLELNTPPLPSSLAKCKSGVLPPRSGSRVRRQQLERGPGGPRRRAVCCLVVSGTLGGLPLLRPPRQ